MTSELVIMTPHAVALAADSAVTIDHGKIYNGINKLFMLSNNPSVGIMFYNNVSFLNIPFETIIKEFRKSINDSYKKSFFKKFFKNNFRNLDKVSEFQNAFIEYLKLLIPKSDFKLSFNTQLNIFINDVVLEIMYDANLCNKIVNFKVPEEKLLAKIFDSLDEEYNAQCFDLAKKVCNFVCSDNDIKDTFIKHFVNYTLWEMFAKNYTGIVFAGFDTDSLFPASFSFKICYLYDEKYVLCDVWYDEISFRSEPAIINMFAQDDVISSFFKSIDPNTKEDILDKFIEINNEQFDRLLNSINNNPNIDDESKKAIYDEINMLDYESFRINFSNKIGELEKAHLDKILQYISVLPFSELSNLCESLIKITSLKRKVGSNLESVGGDVDVAIITKGDGFIWTKRKHYFDGDLNYQFFEKKEMEKL